MASIEFKLRNVKSAEGVTATLAEITGSIDSSTVDRFTAVMDKLIEKGVKNLILDCHAIKYVNSTGLGTLLKYVDILSERNGQIAFTQIPQKVLLVMEMLGFNALFNIVADEAVALKSFGGQEVPPAAVGVRLEEPPAEPLPPPGAVPKIEEKAVARFPLTVPCPRCRVKLEIASSGRYACPRCTGACEVSPAGEVKFLSPRSARPVELTLPADAHLAEGIMGLVGQAARRVGFDPAEAARIGQSVKAACLRIVKDAYGGDPESVYHVVVIPDSRRLTVRISDYGQTFDFSKAGSIEKDARFKDAITALDRIEHEANPGGGNLLTLLREMPDEEI